MPAVKPIRSEEKYDSALRRIDELRDAAYGSPADEELEHLRHRVERYEDERYPIDLPDPIAAIECCMDQLCSNCVSLYTNTTLRKA